MKKFAKLFFGLGLSALLVGGAFAINHKEEKVSADIETADHFMGAFKNQEGFDVPTDWSTNIAVPRWDLTAGAVNATWTVSSGRFKSNYLELGRYSETDGFPETLAASLQNLSNAEYTAIYDTIHALDGDAWGCYFAVLSDNYFDEIKDISVAWSGSGAGNLRFIYQLENSSDWTVLLFDGGENRIYTGNYSEGGTGVENDILRRYATSGSRGGNAEPSLTGDFTVNLKGKKARVGFVYSTWSGKNANVKITNITVNRASAIKGLIDFMDGFGWVCTAISEDGNNYHSLLRFGEYRMLQSQANDLNVTCTLVNGKEPTYFAQFSYLYNVATSSSVSMTPNNSMIPAILPKFDGVTIAVSIASGIALLGIIAFVYLRLRKRHQ